MFIKLCSRMLITVSLIAIYTKINIVLYCIVLYLSISIAILTACAFLKRSRPQQLTLYRSLHAEALTATASEGLAQGSYVAARAGFEPATLWWICIDSTNAPPRLTSRHTCNDGQSNTTVQIIHTVPNAHNYLFYNFVGEQDEERPAR